MRCGVKAEGIANSRSQIANWPFLRPNGRPRSARYAMCYLLFRIRYLVRSLLKNQHIALRNKLILFSQIKAVVIELPDN